MINVNAQNCCGCGACAASCPVKAISIKPDKAGFLYPQVNLQTCIGCGLCERVCEYNIRTQRALGADTYVAVAADVSLKESASGGLFASLAQAVIRDGGVVFGCAMLDQGGKLWPRHLAVDDQKGLSLLKGSKYVQSDLGDAYVQAKQYLLEGRVVLFSGTPCQIAGLYGFLQKKYSNLFTVEIICHGVPNVQFFHDYLALLEQKHDAKVKKFNFRSKKEGWKLYAEVTFSEGEGREFCEPLEPEDSSYYQLFLNGNTYRENCYSCPYASKNRQGDLTIGDYWCVDLVHPEILERNTDALQEKSGVSCLIINTEQGDDCFNRYGKGIKRWKSSYEQAARYNAQLIHPTVRKQERDTILKLYETNGYQGVEEWYQKKLKKIRFERKFVSCIPNGIKKALRPLLKKNRG